MSAKRRYLVLAAILLLAAFFRFHHLAKAGFWADEHMAASSQYESVQTIIQKRLEPWRHPINIEPPGYALLNKVMTVFAPMTPSGYDEDQAQFWLRLLSALAGVLSVFLIYGLARRLADERAARLAALLLAFSFYAIYYSQENRPYSLVIMLALLSTRLWLETLFAGRRALALPYALSIAAVCYLHYTAILLPLVHAVATVVIAASRAELRLEGVETPHRLSWRDLLAFTLAGLFALALYAPWLPHTLQLANDPSSFYGPAAGGVDPITLARARRNIVLTVMTHWGCDGYPALLTYLPLMALGFASLFRRGAAVPVLVAAVYLLPLAYVYTSPYGIYINPRYLIFAFPFHPLLAGLGLITLYDLIKKAIARNPAIGLKLARVVIVAWVAVLFVQNLAGLAPYYEKQIKCDTVSHVEFCSRYIEIFDIWTPRQP